MMEDPLEASSALSSSEMDVTSAKPDPSTPPASPTSRGSQEDSNSGAEDTAAAATKKTPKESSKASSQKATSSSAKRDKSKSKKRDKKLSRSSSRRSDLSARLSDHDSIETMPLSDMSDHLQLGNTGKDRSGHRKHSKKDRHKKKKKKSSSKHSPSSHDKTSRSKSPKRRASIVSDEGLDTADEDEFACDIVDSHGRDNGLRLSSVANLGTDNAAAASTASAVAVSTNDGITAAAAAAGHDNNNNNKPVKPDESNSDLAPSASEPASAPDSASPPPPSSSKDKKKKKKDSSLEPSSHHAKGSGKSKHKRSSSKEHKDNKHKRSSSKESKSKKSSSSSAAPSSSSDRRKSLKRSKSDRVVSRSSQQLLTRTASVASLDSCSDDRTKQGTDAGTATGIDGNTVDANANKINIGNEDCPASVSPTPRSPVRFQNTRSKSARTLFGTANGTSTALHCLIEKKVAFDSIEWREYPIELGDNPSCSEDGGPPLTIGWNYQHVEWYTVNEFESLRTGDGGSDPAYKRAEDKTELLIPASIRLELLLKTGFNMDQILQVMEQVESIRKQRQKSLMSSSNHGGKGWSFLGKLKKLPGTSGISGKKHSSSSSSSSSSTINNGASSNDTPPSSTSTDGTASSSSSGKVKRRRGFSLFRKSKS